MIERAGYPGVAADLDVEKIASVFPAMEKQALDMWEEGRRLTVIPGCRWSRPEVRGRRLTT